jgi:mono/diheme cytochrome c family protein
MPRSLETKALGLAVLAALLSLAGAGLLAAAIKMVARPDPALSTRSAMETASWSTTSPALIKQGREFFEMSCSQCHGDDAHGDEGPDLHRLSISNARIAATIKKGVKGEMPAFAKKYDDRQVAALVSYLRTLR